MGLKLGLPAIPEQWLQVLELKEPVEELPRNVTSEFCAREAPILRNGSTGTRCVYEHEPWVRSYEDGDFAMNEPRTVQIRLSAVGTAARSHRGRVSSRSLGARAKRLSWEKHRALEEWRGRRDDATRQTMNDAMALYKMENFAPGSPEARTHLGRTARPSTPSPFQKGWLTPRRIPVRTVGLLLGGAVGDAFGVARSRRPAHER